MFAAAQDTADHQEALFGDRTVYNIPEANFAKFEKEMAKLSRRSERLIGLPIKPFAFGNEMVTDAEGKPLYRLIQVYLTAETPRVDGWTFVARIDHTNETGNIIRRVPNLSCEIPAHYRDCAPNCDHCKVRRLRRDTFLVRNDETGEFQQVGTSCLTDFFGHDPYKIAKLAEMLGYATEVAEAATSTDEAVLTDRRWIDLEAYLASVAAEVRKNGFVSGKSARENDTTPTRDYALWAYGRRDAVTAEDVATAEAALDWARAMQGDSEFVHNVQVVANAVYIEPRSCGIAAWIVGGYVQDQRKKSGVTKVNLGDMRGVIDLMKRPGSKIKFPKIRLMIEETRQPIELSIAGERSKAPGSVNITDGGPYGNNTWFGRISPTGEWTPSRSVTPSTMSSLVALLSALAAEPAEVAARYGKLTGNCCFCRKPLNDERSVAVGYGGTCAKNYGLPWGAKAAKAVAA